MSLKIYLPFCFSQELKVLTKAVFSLQLLDDSLDGIFQIFDIAHILISLPAPALPGRFSCAVVFLSSPSST